MTPTTSHVQPTTAQTVKTKNHTLLQGFKLQVTNVPKKHDRRESGSFAFVDRMLSNHYQLTLILKPIKTPVSSHFIQCISIFS
jgi:hypothetical protein